jgi:hypothetical protein
MAQGTQGTQSKKIAYSMTERDGKTYWSRIGIAFVNRDGSISVNLEALPVSGRLQLRDEEERRERAGGADRGGQAANGDRRSGYDERG